MEYENKITIALQLYYDDMEVMYRKHTCSWGGLGGGFTPPGRAKWTENFDLFVEIFSIFMRFFEIFPKKVKFSIIFIKNFTPSPPSDEIFYPPVAIEVMQV